MPLLSKQSQELLSEILLSSMVLRIGSRLLLCFALGLLIGFFREGFKLLIERRRNAEERFSRRKGHRSLAARIGGNHLLYHLPVLVGSRLHA